MLRKKSHYDEAVEELHKALGLAEEKKQSIPITRIYDELANTYYEMGNLKDAETLFRVLLKRFKNFFLHFFYQYLIIRNNDLLK